MDFQTTRPFSQHRLGENQRALADEAMEGMRRTVLPTQIGMLDRRPLAQVLSGYETNRTRYVMVIGRDNDRTRTVTLKLVHEATRSGNQGRAPTVELTISPV